MKYTTPPPVKTKQAVSGFKTLLASFALCCLGNFAVAQTPTTFTANTLRGDTIKSTQMIQAAGIRASDTIRAIDQLVADKNIEVKGDIIDGGKLTVSGDAIFNGIVKANQGIQFDVLNGIKLNTVTTGTTTNTVFTMGKLIRTPFQLPPCININPGQTSSGSVILDVVGAIVARNAANTHPTLMGFDGANHILEAGSTGSSLSSGVFLVNFYCGKRTLINTGINGGDVYISSIGKTQIGQTANPPYKQLTVNGDVSLANYGINPQDGFNGIEILGNNQIPNRRGITTDADPNGNFNFFINGNQNNANFNFKNGLTNTNLMRIDFSGKMFLGNQTNSASNAYLTINGGAFNAIEVFGASNNREFLVTSNGGLIAREIRVKLGSIPDYVFEVDYKLLPLAEVEAYYKKHKHLPEVASEKEILANNLNVGEMSATLLKKVEELTLYLVEQNKQLEIAKKEIEALKNLIKK